MASGGCRYVLGSHRGRFGGGGLAEVKSMVAQLAAGVASVPSASSSEVAL